MITLETFDDVYAHVRARLTVHGFAFNNCTFTARAVTECQQRGGPLFTTNSLQCHHCIFMGDPIGVFKLFTGMEIVHISDSQCEDEDWFNVGMFLMNASLKLLFLHDFEDDSLSAILYGLGTGEPGKTLKNLRLHRCGMGESGRSSSPPLLLPINTLVMSKGSYGYFNYAFPYCETLQLEDTMLMMNTSAYFWQFPALKNLHVGMMLPVGVEWVLKRLKVPKMNHFILSFINEMTRVGLLDQVVTFIKAHRTIRHMSIYGCTGPAEDIKWFLSQIQFEPIQFDRFDWPTASNIPLEELNRRFMQNRNFIKALHDPKGFLKNLLPEQRHEAYQQYVGKWELLDKF